MSSENLLRAVARGEPGSMERCMDRYGGLVWSLARRWSIDHVEAEDAVQEVFVTLWKSADRFDPQIASEPTFVTMIARRRLIDRQRRRARTKPAESLNEGLDEIPQPIGEDGLERSEEVGRAETALRQLRPEQQKVLTLAIYEGLSHSEISTMTEMPLGTVKTHARRGLQKVRELLESSRKRSSAGGVTP